MSTEIRPCEWAPRYGTSADGRVWKIVRSRRFFNEVIPIERRPQKIWSGYFVVRLERDGECAKQFLVSRLVAKAWCDGYYDGAHVRHLDGNKENNAAHNLAWGSRVENMADAVRHGTFKRGEQMKNSILTERKVKIIKAMRHYGFSQRDCAYVVQANYPVVKRVCQGGSWRHVTV